jgi:hypothetical protein
VRLDDNKIHIFGARRVNVTGLGAREPRAEELALPKSVETGNLGLNKAVIRWMGNLGLNKAAIRWMGNLGLNKAVIRWMSV